MWDALEIARRGAFVLEDMGFHNINGYVDGTIRFGVVINEELRDVDGKLRPLYAEAVMGLRESHSAFSDPDLVITILCRLAVTNLFLHSRVKLHPE